MSQPKRTMSNRTLGRREFLWLAGVGTGIALVPGALAACGESNDESAAGRTTLSWASWKELGETTHDMFVTNFQDTYPDIELDYRYQIYDDYIDTLRVEFASGRGADVIDLQAGNMVNEYDSFIEELSSYAEESWGYDWQSRFHDVGLDQLKSGDGIKVFPAFNQVGGHLWYNKTIFDRHDMQPPETYEEWIRVCERLRSQGVTPFIHGAQEDWVNFDMYIVLANELAPGKIYEAEAGRASWTDPDLVEAMNIWGEMFENGIMQRGALGIPVYPDARDELLRGEAAMIMLGSWNNELMLKSRMAEHQESLGFEEDWEFLPIPFPDVAGDGERSSFFAGPDTVMALNSSSEVQDSGWQLIEWILSEEAQGYPTTHLELPAIRDVSLDYDEENLLHPETQGPAYEQELEDLENAIGKREFLYSELQSALGDALQNVASGQASIEEAMQSVEEASQNIER